MNRVWASIVVAASACSADVAPPPAPTPSVEASGDVVALGRQVASPIEGLPVPEVARLISHKKSPDPDAQGGQTAETETADYSLPPAITMASLDAWYLQNLPPDGGWRDWERNSPDPGDSATSGDVMAYAWTGDRGCLLIEATERDDKLGIRLTRTSRELCLQ